MTNVLCVKMTKMAAKVNKKVAEESEEDRELKDELRTLVEKLTGKDEKLYLPALEMLRFLIRTATTSMTSVPKPLKYLAEYYSAIKCNHSKVTDTHTKKVCADIVSVLAMSSLNTDTDKQNRDCLHYCLIGTMTNIGDWGHEYVRQLETEICEEWAVYPEKSELLLPLVHQVIEFNCLYHAEIQACDLLMEIDQIDLLAVHITRDIQPRICLYLASCANYVDEIESTKILHFVFKQYRKYDEYIRALIIAMQLRDDKAVNELFNSCTEIVLLKQMAYLAARQQVDITFERQFPERAEVEGILWNTSMSALFHQLGRELDIMEPRMPEDIFKSWLEPTAGRTRLGQNVDSARMNLATSFVNGFINAGFGQDKLLNSEQSSAWVYRNRERGMLSTGASVGLLHLWSMDTGLVAIDKYIFNSVDCIKAGGLLAVGLMTCHTPSDYDPASALLVDFVASRSVDLSVAAIFGLGMAHAGMNRQATIQLLLPVIMKADVHPEVLAVASVSCGLIAVSSCNHTVTSAILQKLIEMQESAGAVAVLQGSYKKLILLGLGLCYLGRKDAIDTMTAALEVLPEPLRSLAQTMVQICAYTGTNDVLIVQEFLHICSEKYEPPPPAAAAAADKQEEEEEEQEEEEENKTKADMAKGTDTSGSKEKKAGSKKKATKADSDTAANKCKNEFCEVQAVATLGVALVSMGEDIGRDMDLRIFGHMAQYGDACIRKAVCLGIALCSLSNPGLTIADVLNKYSHDTDDEVASNAIFSMGLVGAGTNNARLASMLRHLAGYHSKSARQLFMVRLAQGLVHLGKGTLTLNPFHTDRQLSSSTSLAGLLITAVALLDNQNIVNGGSHYLLFSLCAAMRPRWLLTLDETMEAVSVPVRVGQAVDVVAKAGTPKSISGIHTHNTPVLLAVGDRAELATDQYESLSPVMEGIVILRKKGGAGSTDD